MVPGFSLDKVNPIEQMRMDPGGKGINISKVLQGFGERSVATGILGGNTGEYIKGCLHTMSIAHDFVYVSAPTRTNLKIVDPQKHTNTDINEPGSEVDKQTVDSVLAKLLAKIVPGDTVVLAGSVPPGVPDTLYAVWTEQLHRMGARVYLDADGSLLINGANAGPDLIKPNEAEFARLTGIQHASTTDIASAAIALHSRGIAQIVVSLGEKGAVFVRDGCALYANALKVPVRSTVGAGDAAMTALLLGSERKNNWKRTIRMAIAAGAASVMCEGTEAISPDTVEALQKQVHVEDMSV